MPSSTVAPPEELAHTGLNGLGKTIVIGLILLVLGLGAFAYAYAIHKGSRRGEYR